MAEHRAMGDPTSGTASAQEVAGGASTASSSSQEVTGGASTASSQEVAGGASSSFERSRCGWCGDDPLYVAYHDEEWGVPVHDDRKHFEFMVLESAQAGLSWITVLRRREHYRDIYAGFDPAQVAQFDEQKINEMLDDPRMIRNRKKIEASINNARRFLEVQKQYGSFNDYVWAFFDHRPLVNEYKKLADIPAQTPLSQRIAKDLKQKGFQFLGPIIVYSHLQAAGLVNDHVTSCFRHREVQQLYS